MTTAPCAYKFTGQTETEEKTPEIQPGSADSAKPGFFTACEGMRILHACGLQNKNGYFAQ